MNIIDAVKKLQSGEWKYMRQKKYLHFVYRITHNGELLEGQGIELSPFNQDPKYWFPQSLEIDEIIADDWEEWKPETEYYTFQEMLEVAEREEQWINTKQSGYSMVFINNKLAIDNWRFVFGKELFIDKCWHKA